MPDDATASDLAFPTDDDLAAALAQIDLAAVDDLAGPWADYQAAREALAPARYAHTTGIAVGAFAPLDELAYAPGPVYPSMLRLGALWPRHARWLDDRLGPLPYYHDLAQRPGLLLDLLQPETAHALSQSLALRLLASLEPALLRLHCIDAAGLGRAFADLRLGPPLRPERVLTETADIEALLRALKAETVALIQDTLGNRYPTLQAFNTAAGTLAEPWRVLLIAGYPRGFSAESQALLSALLDSADQTGLTLCIAPDPAPRDQREAAAALALLREHPRVAVLDDASIHNIDGAEFINARFSFAPDDQPIARAANIITAAMKAATSAPQRAVRIDLPERPFSASSQDGLAIPIGRSGKDRRCQVRLGAADSPHHGLIGGATGAGKSVLLHAIILHGAWLYGPDELQFLLLDYKEGTEFKPYADLPAVRVLAIESSRAFGLSVFDHLQDLIAERGALFKAADVGNYQDYRRTTGEPLPRLLLVIDEFQVLLKSHDPISRQVATAMDDLARRGRSMGIHLLLCTQTLHGVDLPEATLSNAALRIGLRMSEGDAVKVFHRDNTVATALHRPGDAWLNEAGGRKDANQRVQIAWLDPDERRRRIAALAARDGGPAHRHIFTGLGHADLAGSPLAEALRRSPATPLARYADALLARPAFIATEPLRIRLRRQAGGNLLLVGDSLTDATGLILLLLSQLLRQSTPTSQVDLVNLLPPDAREYDYLHCLHERRPQQVSLIDNAGLEDTLAHLDARLEARIAGQEPPADRLLLSLLDPQQARCLKRSGGGLGVPPATKRLEHLLHEGPAHGVHVLLYSQRYQGFHELFQNPAAILNDFENRIALYGGDSQRLFGGLQEPVPHPGMVLIQSPKARYGIDPGHLYRAGDILDLYADIDVPEGN